MIIFEDKNIEPVILGNNKIGKIFLGNNLIYKTINPYLYFVANRNTFICWAKSEAMTEPRLQYSLNDTNHWQNYTIGSSVMLNSGQRIYWRGLTDYFSISTSKHISLYGDPYVQAFGNINSLINWQPLTPYCFNRLFQGCEHLTHAPDLPATQLAEGCYEAMFNECFLLTEAPKLPATTLTKRCYAYMFEECENLKLSQTKTTIYKTDYRIPSKGTGTNAEDALTSMFSGTGGTFAGTPNINRTYYGAW